MDGVEKEGWKREGKEGGFGVISVFRNFSTAECHFVYNGQITSRHVSPALPRGAPPSSFVSRDARGHVTMQ